MEKQNSRRKWLKALGIGAVTGLFSMGSNKASAAPTKEDTGEGIIKMWTHGNSVELESGWEGTKKDSKSAVQYSHDLQTRFHLYKTKGRSEIFIKDTTNLFHPRSGSVWCHFSIPTPTYFQSKKVRVRKILLNFETNEPQIFLTDVLIYDGNKKIGEFKDLKLYDKHPLRVFDVIDTPELTYGLGVSLRVKAIDARETDYIRFYSVGADLVT